MTAPDALPHADDPSRGLQVDAVLFDLDNTLVRERGTLPTYDPMLFGNGVLEVLAREMAKEQGIEVTSAATEIRHYLDRHVWWDYADIIAEFDLNAVAAWTAVKAWHAESLEPIDATVNLVRQLYVAGFRLYVMSNNPVTGCQLKLGVTGLGGLGGSPWFSGIFGSNNCRGQKSQSAMWRRALAHLPVERARVLMIGDNYSEDGAVPASVGVGHRFIIDPQQREPMDSCPAGIVVQSAAQIAPLLIPKRKASFA